MALGSQLQNKIREDFVSTATVSKKEASHTTHKNRKKSPVRLTIKANIDLFWAIDRELNVIIKK